MASLKITRGGEELTYKITPAVEYAFEVKYDMGYFPAIRDVEKQTHLYWLAWECLRADGKTDGAEFNLEFVKTLESVEVLADPKPKK